MRKGSGRWVGVLFTVLVLVQASWGLAAPDWLTLEAKVFFSPNGGCHDQVIAAMNGATRTLDMAAFSFSEDTIAVALVAAKQRGVAIRLVVDRGIYGLGKKVKETLDAGGIEIQIKKLSGLMHHKYIVVDGTTVLTGSFNFTGKADKLNCENLLVIHSGELARIYTANFLTARALPPYVPPVVAPNSFLTRVKRELRKWVASGLITQEQADRILASYRTPEEPDPEP